MDYRISKLREYLIEVLKTLTNKKSSTCDIHNHKKIKELAECLNYLAFELESDEL